MLKSLTLFLLLLCHHQLTRAFECATPSESKTRIFDSLVHFQGNKLPFSPTKVGEWQGSNVEFSVATITKIPRNSFVTFDSGSIISLKLSGKQIKEVSEEAFYSLICLHNLYLDHNNITRLTTDVFQDLQMLQTLYLSYNKLEIVEDLVFAKMPNLKGLDLSNNRIKTLEPLSFINITSLEYLNLEANEIGKISPDLFHPLDNLKTLILSWNKLYNIAPDKWGGLTKLETLALAGNHLNHFDPSYEFPFYTLKSLNLSVNSLTFLNVMALRRHLPQLELIDLNDNPWYCDTLESIIHELNDSGIKFKSRNYSTVGIRGIACSEVSVVPIQIVTEESTKATTRKMTRNETWIERDELERYVEKKIGDNNEGLKNSIASVRSLVIFVFALVCVLVVFEILLRTNVCGPLINKLRGGNELYVDNSDVENFRLLHR